MSRVMVGAGVFRLQGAPAVGGTEHARLRLAYGGEASFSEGESADLRWRLYDADGGTVPDPSEASMRVRGFARLPNGRRAYTTYDVEVTADLQPRPDARAQALAGQWPAGPPGEYEASVRAVAGPDAHVVEASQDVEVLEGPGPQ